MDNFDLAFSILMRFTSTPPETSANSLGRFGKSRSNRSLLIQPPHFVMDDERTKNFNRRSR